MLDEAIAEYKESIAVEPNYPRAFNNLASAYLEKGEAHTAIFFFMKTLQFRAVRPEALIGLSVAFSKIGMMDRAIAQATKALALKPSLAVAHNNLAYFYYVKQDYARAIAHCDKAVRGGYPVPEQLLTWLEPYRAKAPSP
jgi:Flp pilus assembly protein TadD